MFKTFFNKNHNMKMCIMGVTYLLIKILRIPSLTFETKTYIPYANAMSNPNK